MNNRERRILHRCSVALSSLPGKNNAMSGAGAAQYHDEMRDAVAINNKVMMWLLDGDYEEAEVQTNNLVALVFGILLKEGLAITAAMDAIRE